MRPASQRIPHRVALHRTHECRRPYLPRKSVGVITRWVRESRLQALPAPASSQQEWPGALIRAGTRTARRGRPRTRIGRHPSSMVHLRGALAEAGSLAAQRHRHSERNQMLNICGHVSHCSNNRCVNHVQGTGNQLRRQLRTELLTDAAIRRLMNTGESRRKR